MSSADSILNRGIEGRGVYTGGLSFLLATILGGLAAAFGVLLALTNHFGDSALAQVAAAIGWGAGVGAVGAGTGAVAGLACGSHLARSYHCVFGVALAWIAGVGTLVMLTSFRRQLGLTIDAFERFNVPVGLAAVLLGAAVGALLGWQTDGFTHRARRRATLLGAAGLAAGIALIAYLVHSSPPPSVEQALIPTAIILALFTSTGAMTGALLGADRHCQSGFAVVTPPHPVTPLPAQES